MSRARSHSESPTGAVENGEAEIPAGVRWSIGLRSLTIQGSWNYRTLIGTGMAFALLPVFRWLHRGDEEACARAVRRHAGLFNAHPYMAGLALGAIARMEAEGEAPEVIDHFKVAIRGPLGSIGDRLVWAGWLPACILLALSAYFAGAAYGVVVLAFLALYNAGHLVLRTWSLRTGLREGRGVGTRLREAPLARAGDRLGRLSVFLLGILIPVFLVRGLPEAELPLPWIFVGAAAVALGMWRGEHLKSRTVTALVAVAVGILTLGTIG